MDAPRRIGEHLQHIVLRPRRVAHGAEQPGRVPGLLPFRLDAAGVVARHEAPSYLLSCTCRPAAPRPRRCGAAAPGSGSRPRARCWRRRPPEPPARRPARNPATLSERGVERGIADIDGDPVDGRRRSRPCPSRSPEAPENGSAPSIGRKDRMSSEACQRIAVDRDLPVRLALVAEEIEDALVADLVLDGAPLLRPLRLQLGVAVAAGEHAQTRRPSGRLHAFRSRAGGVLWHPRRVCKVKPAARQVQSGTAPR